MSKIGRGLFCLLAVLSAVSSYTPRALAQTETTGSIQGRVYEAGSNQGIVGARVTLKNEDNGLTRAVLTSTDGSYSFGLLQPGSYMISATHPDYEEEQNSIVNKFIVYLARANVVRPPPIVLRKKGVPAPVGIQTKVQPNPPSPDSSAEQLVNTLNAARGGNFDQRQLTTLPLPGVRSFETLAFLLPGVALPPQPIGDLVGPGIGAGIGSAGQFSVNGQRARSNNFTVDGSDNNDEDIGVRRQGFVALVPQSIESVQDFQVSTHLWDAGMGRNLGSQVNAVSRSGANQIHGSVYDFFNHDSLNARNFFDYTLDNAPPTYPLTAVARSFTRPSQTIPVRVFSPDAPNGREVIQPNPSEGKDPYQRNQVGMSIGGPLFLPRFGEGGPVYSYNGTNRTFFFGSFERQDIKARQETHFSVPTVAQRGFLGLGASGFRAANDNGMEVNYRPTFVAGDAVFSLFPFPNNPIGPYGENTFTQVLPADAEGTIFSLKLDHSFTLFGPEVEHTLTGRYNFTHDRRQVPAVGGALFSGVAPQVGTQNLSLFLNSQFTASIANQLRGSFGRTKLRFTPVGNLLTQPSQLVFNDPLNGPFLLNRPFLYNLGFGAYGTPKFAFNTDFNTEDFLGPIGQLIVIPFSPVGLDTYLFPQARVNNTYQVADTLTLFHGSHAFKFGADIRRTQLNSLLNRNFRPQVIFGGTPDLSRDRLFDPIFNQPQNQNLLRGLGRLNPMTPEFFSGSDLAAIGIPTGIFQALTTETTDSVIGLRSWQYNFFFNDTWRIRRGLSFDYGLRYEYNTVPREVSSKIENTFRLDRFPAADLSLRYRLIYPRRPDFIVTAQQEIDALNVTLAALKNFIGGREAIFDADGNNFGPHLNFAWDPFAGSSTQAGKTIVRGGAGVYYDVTLGNIVSQSRNVFPTFIPFNLDASTFDSTIASLPPPLGILALFNPRFTFYVGVDSQGRETNIPLTTQDGRLNVLGVPSGSLQAILGELLNTPALTGQPSGGGLSFTLPDRRLRSPYAFHFNLQVERELFGDYLVSLAYVGSRGLKLTRFRTPNGGLNSVTVPLDPLGVTLSREREKRVLPAQALPPLFGRPNALTRPIPGLGAFTIFDSSASSTYHSLQASVTKRFSKGWQMTGAYTWSHAIDDVSDVFDLAGAFTLPQNDGNLRAERGDANFDVRHRFALSTLSDVPFLGRFNNASGAKRVLLGGWQLASISTFQTGQPFTVNTSFDINLDGNLTDRIDTTSGLNQIDSRQQRLSLTGLSTALLPKNAQGHFELRDGAVGRNTFRASGVAKTDLTLIKNFRVKEGRDLVLRIEAFNLLNRTHFSIPVRILEAPSFGRSVSTSLNPRQVQFALKYVF